MHFNRFFGKIGKRRETKSKRRFDCSKQRMMFSVILGRLRSVPLDTLRGVLQNDVHSFKLIADFVRLCPGWPMTPDLIVIWAAVVCTLCALCFYVWKNVRQAKAMGVIGQKKEEGR